MEKKEVQRRSSRLQAWGNAASFPYELLLHILSMVSLVDRLANAAAVCRSWRAAASDPSLSPERLDLTEWSQQLSHLSLRHERSILSRAFARGLNISLGGLRTLVFNPHFQLKGKHLLYASSRCPNLQELVLPGFYRNSTEAGLKAIFGRWPRLGSLALGEEHDRLNIYKILGQSCPSLRVLHIRCASFYRMMAVQILIWLYKLRVLRIHCAFDNDELEYSAYRLFGLPELREISITVNNQPARHYTRTSSSQPWD